MIVEFHAVLSNHNHLEYRQASVTFSIPENQYDSTLELRKPLGIGMAVGQDCRVDELTSKLYPVLKRLEGSAVNLDELDFLAKRLDSFCVGENTQFQGMAAKR